MKPVIAIAFLTAGCLSERSSPPPTVAERDFATIALPILNDRCIQCHATRAQGGDDFLAGGPVDPSGAWWDPPAPQDAERIRETLLAFRPAVVDLGSPSSSLLLVKGQHNGPPFLDDQRSQLLTWIEAERDEAGL